MKLQNLLLLAGSYFFYAFADWRFLGLLVAISGLNFYLGLKIQNTKIEKYRKIYLYLGLIQGIGGLAFFKYYNFFIESIKTVLIKINITNHLETLNIIIPLGISFFTFRTVSYLLDIEKGKIKASENWVVFFNYVSFFPSLLSGPIDKAKLLVPQLEQNRSFNYENAVLAMRQIFWGFFKKLVIANNCAVITASIFKNYENLTASTLLLGSFLFTFQIYADFSGYSDMAIGFARLLGFNITKNFNYPFFSQNIAEYWRKWHISLTSWVTEYVFTPLSISFRDFGKWGTMLAITINLVVVGIWHGANWTYVFYGLLHAIYFAPLILGNKNINKIKKIDANKTFPSVMELLNMTKTFTLVMLSSVLFKSENMTSAIKFYGCLLRQSILKIPEIELPKLAICLFFILILTATEWNNRNQDFGLTMFNTKNIYVRWSFYFGIFLAIMFFGIFTENEFIYFQF
ncbi:MAG: MBOAT family protein [Flavobacterium sp.]|nr:MBOAT family protein [Flavobacterium sp.]